MDILNEEFESYKSSVSRMRWFIITSILISVLILIHCYLADSSYQDRQLEMLYGNRISNYITETQKCLDSVVTS